jgi:RND family efflux transporter MFP subunit
MKAPRIYPVIALCAVAGTLLLAGRAAADESSLDCVISPRSSIKLGSPEDGILKEVLVDRGAKVKKNELVARLDMEVERLTAEMARLQAQTDVEVRSGRAQVKFRQKEVARLENLRSRDAISEKLYDEADIEQQLAALTLESTEMEKRMAAVEYQRAQARLDRRSIRSPVDGVVVEVTMLPGEYVHEQTPLMTIAEIDPLYIECFVPVLRYGTVSPGMLAEVKPEPPVGGTYSAQVTVVDSVFDPASRTFGVLLELPNPDYMLPAGLRCSVRFVNTASTKPDGDLERSVTEWLSAVRKYKDVETAGPETGSR